MPSLRPKETCLRRTVHKRFRTIGPASNWKAQATTPSASTLRNSARRSKEPDQCPRYQPKSPHVRIAPKSSPRLRSSSLSDTLTSATQTRIIIPGFLLSTKKPRVSWRSKEKRLMFVDVIEDVVAFQAGIRPGEFLLSIDSEPIVPPKSANFRIGGNHHVEIAGFNGNKRKVTIGVPNRAAKDRPPMIEPRGLSHRTLAPDVGYIRVATFPGAVGQSFARGLDEAIRDLKGRGAQRLIVDIRGNIGGGLGSLRLMSYLCPGKLEIGYSLTRRRLRKGYRKEGLTRIGKIPATKAELLIMALRFKVFQKDRSMVLVTEGLGPQPFHGRIVILINEYTHSAAEMVASFAKQNRLATLVGTRTGGEVLGGANFKLPDGYVLRMPVAGWYTWQGECIEGTGVEPNIAVENTPESLA